MKRQFAFNVWVVLALVLTLGAPAARAATPALIPAYAVTDLGTFGGSTSVALDINAAGQIVGTAYTAANIPRPFLYRDGVMIDLGTQRLLWFGAALMPPVKSSARRITPRASAADSYTATA
jgi:probable HAF family extracellular repeat protein